MAKPHYTPTYQSWQAMRQRCRGANHKYFANYGGRGIAVCSRWDVYANFLADMGERPEGFSIDRIDPDKGYEPDNCRWATRTVQNRNNSQNRLITIGKTTKCLAEWCEVLGLAYANMYHRLYIQNRSVADAFFR